MQTELNLDQNSTSREQMSVSQLTARVKTLLEQGVGEVWVRGEISGFKPSAAGHLYFSLKDSGAVLSCALFGRGGKLKFEAKDGVEVLVHGRISVYAPRGNYQLIVDQIEPVGHGALQLAFEQLKQKLSAEGLFDSQRKRPIPQHPAKIAIVTSPTGAALQDMLTVMKRRNAGIQILVVPTLVQGDSAPPQIVKAIEVVNHYRLADVLVVARGGGAIEDLWCFNDESVVRAIAASQIPTISAVGHEVDFTLADFAADLRAPTPSAAAELVAKSRAELIEQMTGLERRIGLAMSNRIGRVKNSLFALETRLVSPVERLVRMRRTVGEFELRLTHVIGNKLPQYSQWVDEYAVRVTHALEKILAERKSKFELLSGRLEALSPLKVLGRGYTLIEDSVQGGLIKSVGDATAGRDVQITFKDGKTRAKFL